jgi:RNA polymerase sigma-70 factor (ECF subfamily)
MGIGDAARENLERELQAQLSRGDVDGAAEAALRGYGPEILAFLVALHRDEDAAMEVFSAFSEGLWRSRGAFTGHSSVRTWAYAIARNVSLKYRRDARRRAARFIPMREDSAFSRIEALVRSETLPHLRSTVRSRIVELRESLDPDDQALLMLRVDRRLDWKDIAQVIVGDDAEAPLVGKALERAAARLRKRFQGVKAKLREMAQREGLVVKSED